MSKNTIIAGKLDKYQKRKNACNFHYDQVFFYSQVIFYSQVPHFDAGGGVHKLKPDGKPGQEGGEQ